MIETQNLYQTEFMEQQVTQLTERQHAADVLSEIRFLHADLVESGEFSSENLNYAWHNELTRATEAVTNDYVSVTCQDYDSITEQLSAYGVDVAAMLDEGIEANTPEFEHRRRLIEREEQQFLNKSLAVGDLADNLLVTISPPPFEVDPALAEEWGYRLGQMMIRTYEFDAAQNRVISSQIAVQKSTIDISRRLLTKLGVDAEGMQSSEDVLSQRKLISKSENPAGVAGVLQLYHQAQAESPDMAESADLPEYFYSQLEERRRFVIEQAQPFIQLLLDTDKDLAQQIHRGYMTFEQAGRHKTDTTIRVWTMMAHKVDPDGIKDRLSIDESKELSKLLEGVESAIDYQRLMSSNLVANISREAVAIACGGAISGESSQESVLDKVAETLFGKKPEAGKWSYHKGHCVVKTCPSKGIMTDVGPCSICKRCESKFDKGILK